MRRSARCLFGIGLASLLLVTSCDGDDGAEPAASTEAPTSGAPTTSTRATSRRLGPVARLVRTQLRAGDEMGRGGRYREFDTLIDATGAISIEVPSSWTARDLAPHLISQEERPFIEASPDRDDFRDSFEAPGVQFSTLSSTTVDGALADFGFSERCTDRGQLDFDSRSYAGKLQVWEGCGGSASSIVVLAASPSDGSVTTLILAQLVTQADLAALDRAAATFRVLDAG